jgi:hypothetical protein
LPLALAAAMMASNRWFTEVDDECAIIDLAASPVSRTLHLYFSGAGLHEHPPLYDIFLHGWLLLTRGNIHLLRLPSICFYVLGAWVLGEVAKLLGGVRSQFCALAIVALWPFGFHFGRLTTWYSFCFLLVASLTLAYFRSLEKPSAKSWLWVLLAGLALIYSNYFGWAILLCLAFDYLVRNRREWVAAARRLGVTAAILLAAYLPLIRSFHRETQSGIRPIAPSLSTVVNVVYNIYCAFVSESVAPWFWKVGVPACVAIVIALLLALWRTPAAGKALLGYFFALVALLAVMSAVVPKRVLLVSPWLILPVALALGAPVVRGGRCALIAALVFVGVVGWYGIFARRFYAAPHWVEPWEPIARRSAEVVREHGVVVGNNPSFFFYLTYLLPTEPVTAPAGGFAGLLPDSVRAQRVYSAPQWMAEGHPTGSTTLLVKGLHYGSSADVTDEAQSWLDAHCGLTYDRKMVHDRGAELKERYTHIPQPEWRVEVRAYACP